MSFHSIISIYIFLAGLKVVKYLKKLINSLNQTEINLKCIITKIQASITIILLFYVMLQLQQKILHIKQLYI